MKCRFCSTPLEHVFIDLGATPYANNYVAAEKLLSIEKTFPLTAYVCASCYLVQLGHEANPDDLFTDYSYFSSYSTSWLEHCKLYVEQMIKRFAINPSWRVCEIASNDGYLLKNFVAANIPVLGIEPAQNVAKIANSKGINTKALFFGLATADSLVQEGYQADLLIGNNVLAHVPKINDFVGGIKLILAKDGILTMEFPHLLQLIKHCQFDTIYHEHFSYLSLLTVAKIFAQHGLELFDVETLTTHGGSLRIYIKHQACQKYNRSANVDALLKEEQQAGLNSIATYLNFAPRAEQIKKNLLDFLASAFTEQKTVVGYGAPAKGNTLLNYCKITEKTIPFTVDKNPVKQGKYLPGAHIPVLSPQEIFTKKPDYVLILPWNLSAEITEELSGIKEWGGKFVVSIPEVKILP